MNYQLTLVASIAVLLSGCVSQTGEQPQSTVPALHGNDMAVSESSLMGAEVPVFCHLGAGAWHRVLSQSAQGVVIDTRRLNFGTVWQAPAKLPTVAKSRQRNVRWHDLKVPLPDAEASGWGYAFTYRDHKNETVDTPAFRCRQNGPVAGNSEAIPYRDHLDFELEIGLLMHRNAPDRFGYLLINDMTDRGVQVRTYDKKNPAPGFARAKAFEGSMRAGPLLAVADASLWPKLAASLSLNGEVLQNLSASRCEFDPGRFHQDVFSDSSAGSWAVAGTGTSAGTLFRTPSTGEKTKTLVASGFSMNRAKEAWLARLRFLEPGDEIVLRSPLLGTSKARVEAQR